MDLRQCTGILSQDGWDTDPKEGVYLEHDEWIAACVITSYDCTTFFFVQLLHLPFSKILAYFTATLVLCVAQPATIGRFKCAVNIGV